MIGLYGFGIHLVKLGRVFLTLFVRGVVLTVQTFDITIWGKGLDFPGGASSTQPTFLLGANGSAPTKTAINSQGVALVSALDDLAERRICDAKPNLYRAKDEVEHFLGTVGFQAGLSTNLSTGTAVSAIVDGRIGVLRCGSSVTATNNARASVGHTADMSCIDLALASETVVIADVALSTALFDGTNVGIINLGLGDSTGTGDSTDAVDFVTTNGGVWACRTRSNSTTTTTTTSVPASTLNVFSQFTIRVSGFGTLAEFWIDGVLVASHTTNIPAGNTRRLGVLYKTRKTSAHTVDAGFDIDFVRFYQPTIVLLEP
jgi:hypothetical protein